MTLISEKSPQIHNCVYERLRRYTSSVENQNLGKNLYLEGALELSSFPSVPLAGWDDWERDPLKNRSWQWRLNWLSFLPYLVAYHHVDNNDDILNFACDGIRSWLDRYLQTDTSYPFEFTWHDHATALRAEQLVLFAYYCRKCAPNWVAEHQEFLQYLQRAIVVHGQWLAKDSFYSEHTNHGLEQARVLLLLGTVLDGTQAQKWQQLATRRISSELAFSFTSEGIHVENSPAYHVFVFKVFIGIIKDYPDQLLGDLAGEFHRFSERALNFITHILRPDGLLPPIGDTEQLATSDAYGGMLGQTPAYQRFLYALSRGKKGAKPAQLNVVYPRSGYAIFRDHWPGSENYKQAFHVIAKMGCSSRYHHQQDEGHVSVYAGGEDWLIDSGLYNYINKDPVRKYMRGRGAHNVPLISGANYHKKFDHRLKAWKVVEYSESEETPSVAMQLQVLLPLVQTRRISFDRATRVITVADHFTAGDEKERNITLQWHIPKDKQIEIGENRITVESSGGQRMLIEMDGPNPCSISHAAGLKGARVFSCISYRVNRYEPSQVVRVSYHGHRELEVITRFTFLLAR